MALAPCLCQTVRATILGSVEDSTARRGLAGKEMDKSKQKALVTVIAVLFLSGCEGSLAGNVSHPNRQDVTVGGYSFGVVPLSDHWASWWASDQLIAVIPPLSALKPLQVTAIEKASGCTVTSAEYQPGSLQPAYLQASVDC